MKKILPILTVIGCSALFVGCDAMMNTNVKDYTSNIKDFKESVTNYNQTNPQNITKTVGNYNLSIIDRENDLSLLQDDSVNTDNTNKPATIDNGIEEISDTEKSIELINNNGKIDEIANDITNIETTDNLSNDEIVEDDDLANLDNEIASDENKEENQPEISQLFTLYSLTSDIENSCDEFCTLKTNILNAIAESERLSEKLKNNEIELTRQQRLFVNEQSNQLKELSRQLSRATNELSFNLSDLSAIMKENNQDLDALSLKYLIVLDNLVNGNEMLQNGLSSLNLINNMMQINSRNLPPNNTGKILYGFQENDNPPVIKEYYLNENGDLESKPVENSEQQTEIKQNEENEKETQQTDNSKKVNIDTYKDSKLASNIDTYGNNRKNIDTFFNTALFDNDFMYGGNSPYGAAYGGNGNVYGNPYMYQYANYEKQNEFKNSTDSVNNNQPTQNIGNNTNVKKKKKFKLKSNIDTYRDESTPDIKTKMSNFKSSISNFFNKANVDTKNDIIAPIHRID